MYHEMALILSSRPGHCGPCARSVWQRSDPLQVLSVQATLLHRSLLRPDHEVTLGLASESANLSPIH